MTADPPTEGQGERVSEREYMIWSYVLLTVVVGLFITWTLTT